MQAGRETSRSEGFVRFFEGRRRENVIAGIALFASGVTVASLGILNILLTLSSWLSREIPWGLEFNRMMADSLFFLLITLASLPLFLGGYLLIESHIFGIAITGTAVGTIIILTVFGTLNLDLALVMTILCLVSSSLGILGRHKTALKERDSAMCTEATVKFGLRMSGIVCAGILLGIILYITARGVKYVTWEFISSPWIGWRHAGNVLSGVIQAPLGGLAPFIIGSLLLVGMCELIATPLGLGAAMYIAEYSHENIVTRITRFFIETLAGVPSVVIGLVGFGFFVMRLNMGRCLLAGGLSLAFMILPWNIRVAEEAMKAVPDQLREAAYALGASKWQMVRHAVLPSAMPGIITGVLLGLGGAIGETAVVMLTAGDWGVTSLPATFSVTKAPIPSLPVWIFGAFINLLSFQGAAGQQGVWEGQNASLAGSFVLLCIFLAISILALYVRNLFLKRLTGQ